MRFSPPLAILLATTAAAAAIAQNSPQNAPQKATQTAVVAKAAQGPVAPAGAGKPQIGAFGFDMAGRDTNVKPGDDFDRFASGTWERNTAIPADRSSYGMFHVLQDLSRERTRSLLDEAAKTTGNRSGDLYASFMDEAAVDAKRATPVQPWLNAIAGAKDKDALAAEAGKLHRQGVSTLFNAGVNQDDKAPDTYIVGMYQGGLGMPDRDYYLKDDAKLAATRTAYQAYLAKMLTLAGQSNADARAAAVLGFEKALATAHWTRVESRDADKTYNKLLFSDIVARAPGYPWASFAQGAGLPMNGSYLVSQPTAFTGEAKAWADAPLPVLKDYLMLRVLSSYARYLSKDFDDARFAF